MLSAGERVCTCCRAHAVGSTLAHLSQLQQDLPSQDLPDPTCSAQPILLALQSRPGLQNAMTSSEERTSAEAEGYRIERALMDCVAPPSKEGDAIHQCPRAAESRKEGFPLFDRPGSTVKKTDAVALGIGLVLNRWRRTRRQCVCGGGIVSRRKA